MAQKLCLSGSGERQVAQSNARAAYWSAKWLRSNALADFFEGVTKLPHRWLPGSVCAASWGQVGGRTTAGLPHHAVICGRHVFSRTEWLWRAHLGPLGTHLRREYPRGLVTETIFCLHFHHVFSVKLAPARAEFAALGLMGADV